MSNFGQSRNLELSTVYYMENEIDASWSNVTTVLGYPDSSRGSLPIVSTRLLSEESDFLEIGSRTMNDLYTLAFDIFGKSEPNRLDLSQFVKDQLTSDWTYYTHSKGTGETLNRTDAGRVVFQEFVQNTRVELSEEASTFDKHRHIISVIVKVVLS